MAIPLLFHEGFRLFSLSEAIFSYYIRMFYALKQLLGQSSAEWYLDLCVALLLTPIECRYHKVQDKVHPVPGSIYCFKQNIKTMQRWGHFLYPVPSQQIYFLFRYSLSVSLIKFAFHLLLHFSPFVFNIFVQRLFAKYLTEELHYIFKCLY